ncbi:hypothetical protein [Cuspidothrix issatschenkoi]|nr:hypothetical protein [Cuspidothrix issatschenkoi]
MKRHKHYFRNVESAIAFGDVGVRSLFGGVGMRSLFWDVRMCDRV